MYLLGHVFRRLVNKGKLTVIDTEGRTHIYQGAPGHQVTIRLHDKSLYRKMVLFPTMAAGEAYMDGTLTIEQGDLHDFIRLCLENIGTGAIRGTPTTWSLMRRLARRFVQYNPIDTAKMNVAHHYDLSDTLYELFLDPDRQYSCAYYKAPGDSLEQAQEQKKRHIAAKLLLDRDRPLKILDIGSGWGGLALYLAQHSNAHVTGVTLSQEQLKVARRRAKAAGLDDRVKFHLRDYRHETETYDRVVSVGMFEHVGVNHYGTFFRKVRDLLADDGVALLHSIGRADGPGITDPWIRKYIFPGGYSPALSEVMPVVERTGLFATDIEILRLHYAETLKAWREAFLARRDRAAELYDERFCRMWEVYLSGSEETFRHGGHVVFQIQMAKQQDAVPLTRDYIGEWEKAHAPRSRAQEAKGRISIAS